MLELVTSTVSKSLSTAFKPTLKKRKKTVAAPGAQPGPAPQATTIEEPTSIQPAAPHTEHPVTADIPYVMNADIEPVENINETQRSRTVSSSRAIQIPHINPVQLVQQVLPPQPPTDLNHPNFNIDHATLSQLIRHPFPEGRLSAREIGRREEREGRKVERKRKEERGDPKKEVSLPLEKTRSGLRWA